MIRFKKENPRWGYQKLTDQIEYLGLKISKSSVKNILIENGFDPEPDLTVRSTWYEFIRSHWDVLAACDFFTIELLVGRKLIRCTVFFVMELATRKLFFAPIKDENLVADEFLHHKPSGPGPRRICGALASQVPLPLVASAVVIVDGSNERQLPAYFLSNPPYLQKIHNLIAGRPFMKFSLAVEATRRHHAQARPVPALYTSGMLFGHAGN